MPSEISRHQDIFALRSFKLAKVSEISEATAAAAVTPEQRVNFHIGNPIQDARLTNLYQRLIFGLPLNGGNDIDPLDGLAIEEPLRAKIEFLGSVVGNSVAYLPSGGFSSRSPGPLAERLHSWFSSGQEEALEYDLGLVTGRREITIVSGGRWEAVRMLLATLSAHLEHLPAYIHLHQIDLPQQFSTTHELKFQKLSSDENRALEEVLLSLQHKNNLPHFMIMGEVMREDSRRKLRKLCLEFPLFIIESNDAPNHYSLGREAGLSERVIRILSTSSISPAIGPISLAIVAGNAELVQAIETTHFELKGTPSAPEVELCAFMLQSLDARDDQTETSTSFDSHVDVIEHLYPLHHKSPTSGFESTHRITDSLVNLVERVEQMVVEGTASLNRLTDQIDGMAARIPAPFRSVDDPNAGMGAVGVIECFFENWENPNWCLDLEQSLLASFLNHHPEYMGDACTVVSGSARTAFGILGRHCGIEEIVTPDLSWTYEHGFSKVIAVPLTEDLDLDVQGIIDVVSQKLEEDPAWSRFGAVVLNNPHNASGAVFSQSNVTWLVRWLVEHGVRVIDDLSYENVVPGDHLKDYETVRRIMTRLIRFGVLHAHHIERVITVHSFSKTDCLAGARLAVVEIPDPEIRRIFQEITATIQPNLTALLMVYLFYRRQSDEVQQFWNLRNQIMGERMHALTQAVSELPEERNPYGIRVEAPRGSMYPRLVVDHLPAGVSLDWLASGLAPRGIGLIPFSTFARTARGFDLARKSFRLTLGGEDGPFLLQRKTRRVIIDLNRLIEDQESLYTLKRLPREPKPNFIKKSLSSSQRHWRQVQPELERLTSEIFSTKVRRYLNNVDPHHEKIAFSQDHLTTRLEDLRQRFFDKAQIADAIVERSLENRGLALLKQLERELQPVTLEDKQEAFTNRLFDRTVHPTQMYAMRVDVAFDQLFREYYYEEDISRSSLNSLAQNLVEEYFGTNIAIASDEESEELVLDLNSLSDAESWVDLLHGGNMPTLLSFWGDWDGSTRPSGQGHRLVAGALLANVSELSGLLKALIQAESSIRIDPALVNEVQLLESNSKKFWELLNEITRLTSQLEERYLRVLPFDVSPNLWRRIGMRLHMARDPVSKLWQHNDRLERRMLNLRQQRRDSLEHYLQLNRQMQKVLSENLESIQPLLRNPEIAMRIGFYKNTLSRFVLTPRIHQRMILSRDQFAIDTTVHNIVEINRLAGQYGVPGLILALQVSMSTDPEALIALDRKLRQGRQAQYRLSPEIQIPNISVVPLFEDLATIKELDSYLDRVWEYAVQSRLLGQESSERFQEIIREVFFAGSDLSQQIGQPAGEAIYRQAKNRLVLWLSEHNLTGSVRTKLGSGEPSQRQGGYYDARGGLSPVLNSNSARRRLKHNLGDAERRAWELARSPLRGVQSGGEFRTFQSNLSESLRRLPTLSRVELLYHVWRSQQKYEGELERAASALENTRMHFEEHSLQELEMITKGSTDPIYEEFLQLAQEHFRQILYGREEDVVGLHIISHFASRAFPALRDRPVVRPSRTDTGGVAVGQEIVGRLARTLPLSQHGSMLRAIGHNRAQTVILGVNQFTTGIFRAMNEFNSSRTSGQQQKRALEDYVLTQLNVHDMLHTLRLYHDTDLEYVRKLEITFPAGNTAFIALREDNDLISKFIPLLQHELLRRSGMDVEEAFHAGQVKPDLLPALRPDLAVLLQQNIFNTDLDTLGMNIGENIDPEWLQAVEEQLSMRDLVQAWRQKIWEIIEAPIRTQVESFVGLALAIHSLSEGEIRTAVPLVAEAAEVRRLGQQVVGLLRGATDDPLRNFLVAAVQYLTRFPGTRPEVPIDVLRALRDVERIVEIEEQALGPEQQALVRFYVLKIARLCGENG